jgi:Tfp pilus assembly protein PilN
VKPIHLNLAKRPYEDKRLFIMTVVGISIIIAALLFTNIDTYLRYRVQTQTTRSKIAALDEQTEQERRHVETVKQLLSRIDVASLAKQTSFINAQLAQRAFSWSELLDRLEAVLADDVRVTSIAPSFQPDGRVFLSMAVEAKTSDGLVNMLQRFNRDPHFMNPFPSNETAIPGGGYRIALTVEYKPANVIKPAAVQQ